MSTMSEENVVEAVQEVAAVPEAAPTAPPPIPAVGPKKRGRKPKSALPPPPPVEAPKLLRRRRAPRISKGDRAFAAALSSAEKDRAKCIEELSKIMEQWDVKQARLKSLDWKISVLKGNTSTSAMAGMQLQSYASTPTNYPYPPSAAATPFIPPSMRTPTIAVAPQAGGGAMDVGFEQEEEDPDKFLKVGGVIGADKGWAWWTKGKKWSNLGSLLAKGCGSKIAARAAGDIQLKRLLFVSSIIIPVVILPIPMGRAMR
jgi:hypothetical protein